MRRARAIALVTGLFGVAAAAHFGCRSNHPVSAVVALPSGPSALRAAPSASSAEAAARASTSRTLVMPTGAPPALGCDDARRIVAQARTHLAEPPRPVDPRSFGDALVDWLDPHGLWSAAPDAPVAVSIRHRARDLVAELEQPAGASRCEVATEIAGDLRSWVSDLRAVYFDAHAGAPKLDRREAFHLASIPAFEDGPVTRPARELAAELGRRVGAVEGAYGKPLVDVGAAALERTLPDHGVDWTDVVLAAAVRAYLPQIDPHGGWAPLDEETSLYEIDLEAVPPPRLWRRMVRTAVGLRLDETTAAGLSAGDVVLSVGDVATSCLSVEQAEQLTYVDVDGGVRSRHVVVLGPEDAEPRAIDVAEFGSTSDPVPGNDDRSSGLDSYLVPYGDGDALVLGIGDVPDNLGDEIVAAIQRARGEAQVAGVVLDLRGNGGGSTDGASAALGVFLPGASLFPLRRRDGSVEVERAPAPPGGERWTGPVAALVDGDTASAAEMIAGAIEAYHRGPVVGDRTYGKGCAQEYLDDDARAGVLRLTTLVYALPDGSPVQMTGIAPTLRIPMARASERESMLTHAMLPWRGPDVRDAMLVHETPWPGHGGNVGPCGDATVCRALRALGAPRSAIASGQPATKPATRR